MNMDKPLRRVTIFGLLLIVALMINVNYIQGSQAENLQNDSLNGRKFLDVFKRPRGKILAGPEILASSTKQEGKDTYARNYLKDGAVFAPITGFFNGSGASGIELAYSSLLDGRDSRITRQRWFDQFIGKKALGADVETTIKPAAQRLAYNQLAASSRRGAVVMIDIKTGAIPVMASYPSYNPQVVAPQVENGAQKFAELQGQPDSNGNRNEQNAALKPVVNKVLQDTFAPGSSFKAMISASLLANGFNENSVVPAPSSYLLPGTRTEVPNSHEGGSCGGAGRAPLINVFAESCNTTFAKLGAEDLGASKILATAKKFHFTERIEIEPDLKTVPSTFPNASPDRTALGSIGQGDTAATPLHMALVAAAAANNGRVMKPYLVERVRAADQSVIEEADPEELGEPMSGDEAGQLADMMRAVVTNGTATNVRPLDVAGKTGTADIDGVDRNFRWFVGFGPIENPRYAFAVMTEGLGSGGEVAAPIAGRVLKAVRGN